ncbi:MAG: hypothetical protein OIF48_04880 [Silicimonas sp.]|nr:hypothetical protein [Silicimonas sp.]
MLAAIAQGDGVALSQDADAGQEIKAAVEAYGALEPEAQKFARDMVGRSTFAKDPKANDEIISAILGGLSGAGLGALSGHRDLVSLALAASVGAASGWTLGWAATRINRAGPALQVGVIDGRSYVTGQLGARPPTAP